MLVSCEYDDVPSGCVNVKEYVELATVGFSCRALLREAACLLTTYGTFGDFCGGGASYCVLDYETV